MNSSPSQLIFICSTEKIITKYVVLTNIVFPWNIGCVDTPGWTNGAGGSCKMYRKYVCKNKSIEPGYEHAFGNEFNNPERNCCGCTTNDGK